MCKVLHLLNHIKNVPLRGHFYCGEGGDISIVVCKVLHLDKSRSLEHSPRL